MDPSAASSPFSVAAGVLTIQATPASSSGSNPLGLPYNSGVITTYKSFSQLYGYFEVHTQLPAGAGLWPAFWLMPTSFKAGPELDVFEVLGNRPDILYASVHSIDPEQALEQPVVVADTSAAFHTYGVDWEPLRTIFYQDGQAVASVATPSDMNIPMYMILNLAVGGASSWPGAPNTQTQFPANLKIDYVHVFQTANTIGWTDPAPSQPDALVLPSIQAAAPAGNATAYVFVEHYGNQDGGTPLGGIGIALHNTAGQVIATGVTDARGFYTFSNLAAGDYRVQYITPGAFSVHPGGFADASTGITGSFSLANGQSFGVPYQLVTTSAELAGTVQLDGQNTANITVKLLDQNSKTVSTTQTDATGHFHFWVAAGNYTVEYDPGIGTRLAAGSLADSATGRTIPILLADGQTFLLVPENLESASLAADIGPATPVPALTPVTASAPVPPSMQVATPSADYVSVFRFFDNVDGTQFLTASAAERDAIAKSRPDLIAEGVGLSGFNKPDVDDANAAPVYRFFDTRTGTHFYTSDTSERDEIVSQRPDLVLEGTSFYEHKTAQQRDTAVYRFFDSLNGTHMLTSNVTERSIILASRPDLIAEGISFYAPFQS